MSFCASLAFLWYASSMSLVLGNRLIFGYLGARFAFPLSFTACHMAMKGLLASAALLLSGAYTGPELHVLPWRQQCSARWRRAVAAQQLDRAVFLRFLLPLALATAADVALSNLSLGLASVATVSVCLCAAAEVSSSAPCSIAELCC